MDENNEIEEELIEETEQKEVAPQAFTAADGAKLMEELASMKAAMAEMQKPAEPVVAPVEPITLPAEYSPESINAMVEARVMAALKPISDQSQANERQMVEQFRDRLIQEEGDFDDETRAAFQAEAQKQFDSGAADSMEEAIRNASLILAPKTPKLKASQAARRKGRRGGTGRPPQDMAELDEEGTIDAIFAKHNI